MGSDDFRNRKNRIISVLDDTVNGLEKGCSESSRVQNLLKNTGQILDDLDEQFCQQTGLTKVDMGFLFVAIGLQIARQYLLTQFPQRLDDQAAAKNTSGHSEEHSNRKHRYYNPSLEEIITNPVPFDANIGANGVLKGGGKMGHRVTAIGHDPLLGLIFGTANIATSTLTTSKFESFHISTYNKRDFFKNQAKTELVLNNIFNKMMNSDVEGKTIVGASLMKEIIHLKSDIDTKHSLPLPIVSIINSEFAAELADYGLDMANVKNVGKQASYATLVNVMIAMVHGLFNDGVKAMDRKQYEVRTRKILSYSNLVASSSNLAVVAVTRNPQILDLGGLAVTIYRLITDAKFIRQVKEEFIFGGYRDMIMGND